MIALGCSIFPLPRPKDRERRHVEAGDTSHAAIGTDREKLWTEKTLQRQKGTEKKEEDSRDREHLRGGARKVRKSLEKPDKETEGEKTKNSQTGKAEKKYPSAKLH